MGGKDLGWFFKIESCWKLTCGGADSAPILAMVGIAQQWKEE